MPKSKKRNVSEILKAADETLTTAEYGLKDLVEGPQERKLPSIRNLVVFGRATTNVLQNLKSIEARFDGWYEPYRHEMESDPLMKFFYELRSEILKEGTLDISQITNIWQLNLPNDLGPTPPNAKAWFVGGNGVGWRIELPDGTEEYFFVTLPSHMLSIERYFRDAPLSHLGERIEDKSVEQLSGMYIGYLRNMLEAARRDFL